VQDGFERTEEDDLEGVVVKPLQAPYRFGHPKKGDLGWMKWKRDFGESWEVDAVCHPCPFTPLQPTLYPSGNGL
jgi:ATP-dependent DNA ligase